MFVDKKGGGISFLKKDMIPEVCVSWQLIQPMYIDEYMYTHRPWRWLHLAERQVCDARRNSITPSRNTLSPTLGCR